MNVLFLGNGFDLYNGLPTKYEDFFDVAEYCSKHTLFDKDNAYSILKRTSNGKSERIDTYADKYEEILRNIKLTFDIFDGLSNNLWYDFFCKEKKAKTWIDLEKLIEKGLREFDTKRRMITLTYGKECDEKESYTDVLYRDFNAFCNALKNYLKYFVDAAVEKIDKSDFGNEIWNKNVEAVISLNYTNTYEKLYDDSISVFHFHGSVDKDIILGIQPDKIKDETEIDATDIKYKKYYQIITKQTDYEFSYFYESLSKDLRKKKLIIIGHSLDSSDEDILKLMFEAFDKIEIYYHDNDALHNYIVNLVKIYGQTKFSEMTLKRKIVFCKLNFRS